MFYLGRKALVTTYIDDLLESPFTLQNIFSLQLLTKLKPYVHDWSNSYSRLPFLQNYRPPCFYCSLNVCKDNVQITFLSLQATGTHPRTETRKTLSETNSKVSDEKVAEVGSVKFTKDCLTWRAEIFCRDESVSSTSIIDKRSEQHREKSMTTKSLNILMAPPSSHHLVPRSSKAVIVFFFCPFLPLWQQLPWRQPKFTEERDRD